MAEDKFDRALDLSSDEYLSAKDQQSSKNIPLSPQWLYAKPTEIEVRKKRLGDRVTALHQIVSPFRKTDTASVLQETIGYIRFLLCQIEALINPYVCPGPTTMQPVAKEEQLKDLKSHGLCLVPISDARCKMRGAKKLTAQ